MEIWKPAYNFPGYVCSTEGRIKNVRTQRIQKPTQYKNGCTKVSMYRDKKRYNVKVHRVIAESFLGEHPGMDVRHKDEDRSNNRPENLEWCTRSELLKAAYSKRAKRSTSSD